MNRRTLLQSSVALAVSSLAVHAADAADKHKHHHHEAESGGNPYAALIHSTAHCLMAGEACLAHCIKLMADGDGSMGPCATTANQMLALCGALQKLASQQSPLTPALAKVALEACKACEAECKKHENHHNTCKACREACTECIKQCEAVAKA
ncbi:four-helix bundle copper-binding protein [Burkholderiaceae bacterium DAT-1]|nr:four-helix bundle copper-binding protein [Burkholderiaceae bacterium DAT-1]